MNERVDKIKAVFEEEPLQANKSNLCRLILYTAVRYTQLIFHHLINGCV